MSTFKKLPEEVRRKQILEAALKAFAEDGYDKVSMARIAREAGLTKGGVYFHFASKEELFSVMVEAEVERRWGILEEVAEQTRQMPAALALQAMVRWWFARDDRPYILTPAILSTCVALERPRNAFKNQIGRVTALLAEILERLLDELGVQADPEALADLLMMVRVGAIWQEATTPPGEVPDFHDRNAEALTSLVAAFVERMEDTP